MKRVFFILMVVFFISGCNPCKQVSKHPECFPADTVRENNTVIKYEKIYITEDSLIYDTIPCDPITDSVIVVEKVYKTIYRTKIDTIYKDVYQSKINPVNTKLKVDNDELSNKVDRLKSANRKLLIGLIVLIIGLIVWIYFKV